MDLKVTNVFTRTYDALNNSDIRFVIEQGGSRSSKTVSLCQLMIVYCLANPNKIVSIVRKTLPALKGSVMRDFFEILRGCEKYNPTNHNKTDNMYLFDNGSMVEFFSVDDEQKLRGRKRDICWVNESNDISFEEYLQLNMRTTEKMFFDFNPSEMFHWLYDLISRPESILIKSTYHDNPFLPNSLVVEIENFKNIDEDYYRVYALGEKGHGKTTIYTHWKYFESAPQTHETTYGLDFGFNAPTSLVRIDIIDNRYYVKELIYESGLTSQDIINKLRTLNISSSDNIICDSARPEIIEDLKRNRFNALSAIKDVKDGIDSVKTSELFIHKESLNILKELSSYKWKMSGEIVLDEPVKLNDHHMDSIRYGIHYHKQKNKKASGVYHIL